MRVVAEPADRSRPAALHDRALRTAVTAGLERIIWTPLAGVSDFDRVEAVQLLGQFRDPAATAALGRVLRDAPGRIEPRPLGRWLRDTALDTLLRAPAQRGPATDRLLAAYYNFGARIRQGRLARNIVYDDIPMLVRGGRGPLVLRAYVLPLLLVLAALAVVPELLDLLLGTVGGLALLLGAVFFLALGLAVFNLHQVVLVLLMATLGARLRLPVVRGPRRKASLAALLTLLAGGAALVTLLLALRNAVSFSETSIAAARTGLLVLPLLLVPCYMLAYDLEHESGDAAGPAAGQGLARLAVALRWASGTLYVVFVLAAYSLSYFAQVLSSAGQASDLAPVGGPISDLDVLRAALPFCLYLLMAPLPVLVLLAGLGRLQHEDRPGPRPQPPLSPGNP